MVTIAQFIDSIEHLTAGRKAALKTHVEMDDFGAHLDAECDELFKEALRENLPATFNALECTAVKRMMKHPGECLICRLWFFIVTLHGSLPAKHTQASSRRQGSGFVSVLGFCTAACLSVSATSKSRQLTCDEVYYKSLGAKAHTQPITTVSKFRVFTSTFRRCYHTFVDHAAESIHCKVSASSGF